LVASSSVAAHASDDAALFEAWPACASLSFVGRAWSAWAGAPKRDGIGCLVYLPQRRLERLARLRLAQLRRQSLEPLGQRRKPERIGCLAWLPGPSAAAAALRALGMFVVDMFKSRSRLEADNLLGVIDAKFRKF
jgi:hypothetical protein